MVAFDKSKLGSLIGNPEVEQEGVWFPMTPEGEKGLMFKLAYANSDANPEYAKAFEQKFRRHRKLAQANGGNLPSHLTIPIMNQLLAEVLIKDWKNVPTTDGSVPANTPENKLAFLEAFPRTREMALAFAREAEYFSDSAVVEDRTDMGNSRRSSPGSLNTDPMQNT